MQLEQSYWRRIWDFFLNSQQNYFLLHIWQRRRADPTLPTSGRGTPNTRLWQGGGPKLLMGRFLKRLMHLTVDANSPTHPPPSSARKIYKDRTCREEAYANYEARKDFETANACLTQDRVTRWKKGSLVAATALESGDSGALEIHKRSWGGKELESQTNHRTCFAVRTLTFAPLKFTWGIWCEKRQIFLSFQRFDRIIS